MIRLLPFILIPILIVSGLGYWRFFSSKSTPKTTQEEAPIEVPKVLPDASLENRVKSLEDTLGKLAPQVNNLKSTASQTLPSPSLDLRSSDVEGAITELKARMSALEKATPAPQNLAKSTVYIPLGSGGGPWGNLDWYTTLEYEVSLDPANYPGYTGMVLEVTYRLVEAVGTGSVRLYNVTDSSATSGQVDTTSSSFSLKTTSSFQLPSGSKTYKLQVKSTQSKDLSIQSARIRVNF